MPDSRPDSRDDYYRLLQVSRSASRTDIKAAFRRLARRYHPDLNPNNPKAEDKFRALREAYEVLTDKVRRQRYDQTQNPDDIRNPTATPETSHDFYIRGVYHALSRSYQAALADYTQAIRLDPRFTEAYMRRGQVRYVLGDDSGVLEDCQSAIALDPDQSQAYYYQGLARYRLGYTQSAIAAFTEAIRRESDNTKAYYQRGLAHQDIQETPQAIADFQTAAFQYRDQGDMASYQRLQDHIYQTMPTYRRRIATTKALGWVQVGPFVSLLFTLLSNPTGEILSAYARLDRQQAVMTGNSLAVVADIGFTVGLYKLTQSATWQAAVALWISGGAAFLALAAGLAIARGWQRRRSGWSGDVFLAGAMVLPMGILALISPYLREFGTGPELIATLFAGSHTLLIGYSGSTQIQAFSEKAAAWLMPGLCILSAAAGWGVWQLLARSVFGAS